MWSHLADNTDTKIAIHTKKVEDKQTSETPGKSSLVRDDVKEQVKTRSEIDQEQINSKEDIIDPKDDVPQLLSADDLQRLAANQPKSLQPPVLIRRGTVLDETIEKLKKRVESPDLALLNLPEMPANKQSCFGEMKSDSSQEVKDPCTSDKKGSCYGDQQEDNDRSESSSPSRNSSLLSQSTSSRSSSPAVELINRFKESNMNSEQREKSSEKGEYIVHFDLCGGYNPKR